MHPTSKFYNYLVSYTINVLALQLSTILYYQFRRLQLSTILYNQFRRFTTLYYLIQPTSTFYNSLLSYTISTFYNSLLSYTTNFDVLQLSSILYNKLRVLQLSILLINFDVLQLSTILYNQLRRFTTL